jgi:hypothetical protein
MSPSSSFGTVPSTARLVMACAVLGATAAAGVVVACGSDGAAAIADPEGGGGDGGADLDASERPDDDETDGPFMSHADAGCPVKFVGPRPGTVATSVPRVGAAGAIAWETPGNALTVDGQLARAVLDDDQVSEHLRVTGYGFDLPASVTIKGVVVQLKRKGANAVVDGTIELWLDGAPSARPKFVASGWPTAIGTHHYGQEIDTWGSELTPEIIGKTGFGTELYAKRRVDAGTGPVAAEVESLLITVWYCD